MTRRAWQWDIAQVKLRQISLLPSSWAELLMSCWWDFPWQLATSIHIGIAALLVGERAMGVEGAGRY
jgi:hypothetical protein